MIIIQKKEHGNFKHDGNKQILKEKNNRRTCYTENMTRKKEKKKIGHIEYQN